MTEQTVFGLSVGNAVTVASVLVSVGYNYATLHFLREKFAEFKQDAEQDRASIMRRIEVSENRLTAAEINIARISERQPIREI